MILKLKTSPTQEVVSLDEAKLQIRVDGNEEDNLIQARIETARQMVEDFCGPLLTQTWYQYEQDWPSGDFLYLGKPRLQSVTSVKYTDEDGVESTFNSSYYSVDTENEYKPAVVLKPSDSWPTATLFNKNPIKVEFVCGYGDSPANVPRRLWQAIMLLIGHMHEERQVLVPGMVNLAEIPLGFWGMIADYRIY